MKRSIPEHWVERLFSRMASLYGSRFADMWRDCDITEVKAAWREGLADLNDQALRRGVAALFHEPHPPSLPRFLELCRPQPSMYRPPDLALTDERRTPPGEAREQLGRLYEVAAGAVRTQPVRDGGIAWADRLFERHGRGEVVTLHQLELAREAITAWAATHGQHENGHTREPGSDDE